MIISVYLHDEIYSILRCYGNLDDVVNKVLDAGTKGEFDFSDKPMIPNRSGARRFNIDVRNEEYISLVRRSGPNSPKTSLRRLLYWFVENEMYDILEWETVDEYRDRYCDKRRKSAKKIRQELETLSRFCSAEDVEKIEQAIKIIKELEN